MPGIQVFGCVSTIAGVAGRGKRYTSSSCSQAPEPAICLMDLCPCLTLASSFRIALAAVESLPNPALAPFGRRHPSPLDPRRVMPDVLAMAALQVGHPVSLCILVQGNDGTLQIATSRGAYSPILHVDTLYSFYSPLWGLSYRCMEERHDGLTSPGQLPNHPFQHLHNAAPRPRIPQTSRFPCDTFCLTALGLAPYTADRCHRYKAINRHMSREFITAVAFTKAGPPEVLQVPEVHGPKPGPG
jgi:hypothetical protein